MYADATAVAFVVGIVVRISMQHISYHSSLIALAKVYTAFFFREIREMWINRMESNVLAISIRLSVSDAQNSLRCSLVRNECRCVSEKIQQEPKFALQNHPKLNDNIQPNQIRISHLVDGLKSSCESDQLILEHWT